MDNNADIAKLILEFITRQPIEDRALKSALRSLPLPSHDLNLQKLLLLKKLESDVSRRSISQRTVEFLEMLEEIEIRQGNEAVSDAMKRAYCAVAVDCTLKSMEPGGDGGDGKENDKFLETVERLWPGKMARIEELLEKGELGSVLLRSWKDELEAVVRQDSSVLDKYKDVQAVEAVRVYVNEEREKMGPSFIELLVKSVVKRDNVDPSFLELVSQRVESDSMIELMALLYHTIVNTSND